MRRHRATTDKVGSGAAEGELLLLQLVLLRRVGASLALPLTICCWFNPTAAHLHGGNAVADLLEASGHLQQHTRTQHEQTKGKNRRSAIFAVLLLPALWLAC